MEEWQ
jgi:serine/threonine protein kinase